MSEQLRKHKDIIDDLDAKVYSRGARVWIFQTNPKRYNILNALADQELSEDVWEVTRYKDQIHSGHIALIWMSGKEAGIYAIADIISDPEFIVESDISAKYWINEGDKKQIRLRVRCDYVMKLTDNPVKREELRNTPGLQNMGIFKQPQGTNFRVSDVEWDIIKDILKKKLGLM